MYHVKEDKRSQRSAQIIVSALYEICRTTPFRDVTVSDIHKASGVSRATFYRLFDSLEDVLIFQCDQVGKQLHGSLNDDLPADVSDCVAVMLRISMDNDDLVELLVHNHRLDVLWDVFGERLRNFKEKTSHPEEETLYYAYKSEAIYAVISSVLSTWVTRGKMESAKEIQQILRALLRF